MVTSWREDRVTGLVSFATVGALWVLSRAIMATIRALDVAYRLPQQISWIKTRLKGVLLNYRYGPNHHRPWSWNARARLSRQPCGWSLRPDSACIWTRRPTNQVFGVLGGALTLMLWLFLLGLALLLGAQLNYQVDRLRERPRMPKEVGDNPPPAPA